MTTNIVLGTVLLFIGSGFQLAQHDASINADHNNSMTALHQNYANSYLRDELVNQARAEQELKSTGNTKLYQDLQTQASFSRTMYQSETNAAETTKLSASEYGSQQNLYAMISVASFAVGGALIINGLISELYHGKATKHLKEIKIKPIGNFEGGQLTWSKRF